MPLLRCFITAAVALLAAVAVPGLTDADGVASTGPRVSVISDSILTAVTWGDPSSLETLSAGLDLQIDAGVCRRLNGQSCEFNGGYAPTTLSVINSWSTQLGSIVVIIDGYNDLPANFAGDVELTLDTLRDWGVQHVLWPNLHNVAPEYAAKNAVLAAAASRHLELRVLDWNGYAAPHSDWFQTDFIHLRPAGGAAISTWLRQAITDAQTPPAGPGAPASSTLSVVTPQALVGRVGVRFARRLRAGGAAPLHWRTTDASLRKAGLHLLANGELAGRPAHAKTFAVPLEVTDANGETATITVTLKIKRAGHVARHARRHS